MDKRAVPVASAAGTWLRPHSHQLLNEPDQVAAGLCIGVLALQGAFSEHLVAFRRLGASVREVRRVEHLDGVQALAIPGGESTTMSKLLATSGLFDELDQRFKQGFPAFGTCAGMILLANEILDGRSDQIGFGAIDISVKRNGYGRQIDSFEAEVTMPALASPEIPVGAVFIRAPRIERVGNEVEILGTIDETPVVVRQKNVIAAAFHPEMTPELRLHRYFVERIVLPSLLR